MAGKVPPNVKAEKGTVVHKALEILANIKLHQQQGKSHFEDDVYGTVDVNNYDLDDIIYECTQYYKKHSQNEWVPLDEKHCSKWTYKALEYNDGEFDPRNAEIVKPEDAFDITIEHDWAKYEYEMPDGSHIEGNLAIKGTIDQISKVDNDTYQILDWKTGRRLNWATGEEKTYEKLTKDAQLMMYYYAIQHMYPDVPYIDLVIYFINDGGPFTLHFTRDDIPVVENMLRKKFEHIKKVKLPQLSKSWKCTKFCHMGRTTFEGTSVLPIVENRRGQVTPKGQYMTKCEQTKYCLEKRPMNKVLQHMSKPGHSIDHYDAPGEVEDKITDK